LLIPNPNLSRVKALQEKINQKNNNPMAVKKDLGGTAMPKIWQKLKGK